MTEEQSPAPEMLGRRAVAASRRLASLSAQRKNQILDAVADGLVASADRIRTAREHDLTKLGGIVSAGADPRVGAGTDLAGVARVVRNLTGLGDPVGRVDATWLRPNGLKIEKVRIPLGVIALVHDRDPIAVVESVALCLKAGNAVIAAGTVSYPETSRALLEHVLPDAIAAGLPEDAVIPYPSSDDSRLAKLLRLEGFVDVVIPRGSMAMCRRVASGSLIPVLYSAGGVCHAYIDEECSVDMALRIVLDAKCGACDGPVALRTVLLHRNSPPALWGALAEAFRGEGIDVRADEEFRGRFPGVEPAGPGEWGVAGPPTVVLMRIVGSVDGALAHIAEHGSGLAEVVVSSDRSTVSRFTQAATSACVYVNASPRFTDGVQFGMGGEIGVSTGKLHARGPLGLDELTTYKYIISGNGQIRS